MVAATSGALSGTQPRKRGIDWTNTALLVWGIGTLIFLFLPIVLVTAYSFNSGQALLVWKGFSFEPFQRAFETPTIRDSMLTSLRVAFVAAILATIIGSFAGLALARRPGKWTVLFVALIALVLVTPEIVDGISMLLWFVKLDQFGLGIFSNGWVRLFIGTSLFAVAVVTLIVRARVAGLDESMEEAASDLYATPWNRFRQITLPLLAPAVIASFLLAFSLSLDNTVISQFVSTGGISPWPVYVWGSVKNGLKPEIAAMSTVLLALTILALILVALVLRRSGDSSKQIAATLAGQ